MNLPKAGSLREGLDSMLALLFDRACKARHIVGCLVSPGVWFRVPAEDVVSAGCGAA